MSNQSPQPTNPNRATLYTILVAVAVLAIWFGSTTLLGRRLPELDRAYATAIAATETASAGTGTAEQSGEVSAPDEATATVPPLDPVATEVIVVQVSPEPAPAPATAEPQPTNTPRPAATSTPRPTPTPDIPTVVNGLPTIVWDDLPPEAHDTILLIDEGGPFPFDRDGITFENREGLLPDEPRGYYREFTVVTPGESDRGARRIVAGEDGELYYTDDHYDSFSYVVR